MPRVIFTAGVFDMLHKFKGRLLDVNAEIDIGTRMSQADDTRALCREVSPRIQELFMEIDRLYQDLSDCLRELKTHRRKRGED